MRTSWFTVLSGRSVRAVAGVAVAAAAALAWAVPSALAVRHSDLAKLPAGFISTVAGGVGGPGLATSVFFDAPAQCSTVQFADGHLYIADQSGAVRTVNVRTDWLRTPAGVGVPGYSGDGGPGASAELASPCAATVDAAGNLVIADTGNGRLRIVAARSGTFYGRRMTAGDIYTVAGGILCVTNSTSGTFCPVDVTVDHSGNLLVSNQGSEDPRNPGPDQIVLIAARSGTLYGHKMKAGGSFVLSNGGGSQVQVDRAGNLLMADSDRSQVGVLAEKTGRFYGQRMKAGNTYNIAGTGVQGFSGDGGPAVKAELDGPVAVAVDRSGNVVIGDTGNNRVRVIAVRTGRFYGRRMTAGDIYTVAGRRFGLAGNGVPAIKARVTSPDSVAVDSAGNLVECDGGFLVRVIAASSGRFYGQKMKAGDIYTVAGNARLSTSGDRGPATRAQIAQPDGMAVDRNGNMLLTDGPLVWVVAARSGTFYGQQMTAGDIYAVAGGGTGGLGDGGPATRASMGAFDVAADAAGNLVISDGSHNRIRIVAVSTGTFYGAKMTAGDIYTVAGGGTGELGDGGPAIKATFNSLEGVAVDPAGNLVAADLIHGRVRVVAVSDGTFYGQKMTAGDIYTVAGNGGQGSGGDGGPAVDAELQPKAVAIDSHGNLVITDTDASVVRVVAVRTGTFYGQKMSAGDIYTVAGGGTHGLGDGGPAIDAELSFPWGVAVDGAGNILVADDGDGRVRVVAISTGIFYGAKMTAGDIYTVAGNGTLGFSGDGGPAARAEFFDPTWVAVDGDNLLVADNGNDRVRMVSG